MRVYFLVEGEKTEMKLYPAWISYLIPELVQVDSFKEIKDNSFFLFCGQGIPSIYNHTVNAIKDINTRHDYDYLVVCLDGENLGTEGRKRKLLQYLEVNNIELNCKCKIRVIVQNSCVETWFLGNRKFVKSNPEGETLKTYLIDYNIKVLDPEEMPVKEPFKLKAQFHESYLKEVFQEHNLNYRKARPKEVLELTYLNELIKRVNETPDHLNSLQDFFRLIDEFKAGLIPADLANVGVT